MSTSQASVEENETANNGSSIIESAPKNSDPIQQANLDAVIEELNEEAIGLPSILKFGDGVDNVSSRPVGRFVKFEDGTRPLATATASPGASEMALQTTASMPENVMKRYDSLDEERRNVEETRLKRHPNSLDSIPKKRSWRMMYSPRTADVQEDYVSSDNVDEVVQKRSWRLTRGFSSTRFLSSEETPKESDDELVSNRDITDEPEETAEEIAARKLQQRLRQAKKLENFFLKTDVPPRPPLVRSRYDSRDWNYDVNNDWLGRCSNPNICAIKNPFFSAFHISWLSFFFCFMGWFAIGPIVPLLLQSGFSQNDINVSNALALASTIIIRFILGPLCESYGAKLVMTFTLAIGGVLVCSTSGVTSGSGLMVSRFFIGLIGGAFVPCQFWISMMFSGKIVGFVSGAAAGFGNAGAGVIVFLMGGLIAAFQGAGYTPDQTWRYSLLIPGLLMIAFALPTYLIPADCPQGKWADKKYGTPADKIGRMAWIRRGGSSQMQLVLKTEQRIARARWVCTRYWLRIRLFFLTEERYMAFWDWRAWMVGIQYSVASGVELSILTGLTAFYNFEFGCGGNVNLQLEAKAMMLNGSTNGTSTCLALDNVTSAYIAAIFGMTNLYGRMIGGGISDFIANRKGIFHGIRGRHLAIFVFLLLQGVFMMIWSTLTDWVASAGFLVLFSSIVHCAKGAVIAIAPFVRPGSVGPVMGVVSAVGNLGGVLMSLMYSDFTTSRQVYYWQSLICIVGSITAFLLKVHDLELNKDVWLLSRPPKNEKIPSDEEWQGISLVRWRSRNSKEREIGESPPKEQNTENDSEKSENTGDWKPLEDENDLSSKPLPKVSFAFEHNHTNEEESDRTSSTAEAISPSNAATSSFVVPVDRNGAAVAPNIEHSIMLA